MSTSTRGNLQKSVKLKNVSYISSFFNIGKPSQSRISSPLTRQTYTKLKGAKRLNTYIDHSHHNSYSQTKSNSLNKSKNTFYFLVPNLLHSCDTFGKYFSKRSQSTNKFGLRQTSRGKDSLGKSNSNHGLSNNSTEPLLTSSSSLNKKTNSHINNIKIFYSELSKHLKKGTKFEKEEIDNNAKAKSSTQGTKDSTQNNTQSSRVNSITKIKGSKYRVNTEIDTPEELHFFYVNVIQNGKELGSKF